MVSPEAFAGSTSKSLARWHCDAPKTRAVISATRPVAIASSSSRKMQSAPTVHCTGQDEEKAPQRKSLQGLLFTQSGRRDLKPRTPEPHSGALPGCATSRKTRRVDAETPRRPEKATTTTERRPTSTLPTHTR